MPAVATRLVPAVATRLAWRNRALCWIGVAAFLATTRAWWPEPAARAEAQYLLVLTLGYGHLIGAALSGVPALAARIDPRISRPLLGAFAASAVATLFAAYALATAAHPSLVAPLLAVSVWHAVENDAALARAYRERLTLGPLPRRPGPTLATLAVTLLLLSGGAATLENAGLLDFGDLFAAATLYHLLGFLVLFADRVAALRAAGRAAAPLVRRLAAVHVAPALACALLVAIDDPWAARLRAAVFSPGIYLFGSVLHVAQTLAARGIEPRSRRLPRVTGLRLRT